MTALEPAEQVLPLTGGSLLRHAGGRWEIVQPDGTARALKPADPERDADPYYWFSSVPVSEGWVALNKGGFAIDLLHMPTGAIKAVNGSPLRPFPWSGEVPYGAVEAK